VLRETARRIMQVIRSYDFLGRYGGEEFLVVLPGCDRTHALQSAERIRSAVAGAPVPADQVEIPVTISIGVTAVTANASEKRCSRLPTRLYIRRRVLGAIAPLFCEFEIWPMTAGKPALPKLLQKKKGERQKLTLGRSPEQRPPPRALPIRFLARSARKRNSSRVGREWHGRARSDP
jgi:predicted signal transduction protein with EAL and GGDEF domain